MSLFFAIKQKALLLKGGLVLMVEAARIELASCDAIKSSIYVCSQEILAAGEPLSLWSTFKEILSTNSLPVYSGSVVASFHEVRSLSFLSNRVLAVLQATRLPHLFLGSL